MKGKVIAVSMMLILMIALCLPVSGYAVPGGQFGKGGPQCPFREFFYTFFNITEEQQAQLEEISDETRAQLLPEMQQLRKLRNDFSEAILAETIDTEKAAGLIEDMVAVRATVLPIQANAKVEAAQILTPEQRADIQGVMTDITDFIDYILAYPELDNLKDKYSERILNAIIDSKFKDLNLTEEQKQALIDLDNETRTQIKPYAEQLHDLRAELADILLAADIDTDGAADLIEQMIEPASQMATIQGNSQVEAAQILTPEQRRILLIKKRMYDGMHGIRHGW
jgi:Spy/CpxP family protein refolding chaperone